jgi:hypothetical protein
MSDHKLTAEAWAAMYFGTWEDSSDSGLHRHECLGCHRRIACYQRHGGDYSYFVMARQCVHCSQEDFGNEGVF